MLYLICLPAQPPPVSDDVTLSSALTVYVAKQFKNQFDFEYQERPPDSQDTSLFCKTFNALSYFQDGDVKDVEAYLTTKILRYEVSEHYQGVI
jgi:hypothetical protein